jgi:site-specific DNA-methyltransferase (adenine-specific)
MVTKRQKQVLDFITNYQERKGYAPSLDEIRKKFKLASVSTAHFHISKLQDLGLLSRKEHQPRAIEATGRETMIKIPLLGTIAAGQPIEAIQDKEMIAVPKSKIPSSAEIYALRVVGDSMIDENINDGDVVLVRQQETAENGQKVVALIDNHEATLKKFYKERGHIRLQPANRKMEPLIFRNGRDIAIQGIVLDVIRDTGSGIAQEIFLNEEMAKQKKEYQLKSYYERPKFKLYHANCLDVLAKLPENSIDMIFADPPYNLSNGGITVHAGRMVSVNKGDWDKSKGFRDDYDFHYKWLAACRRVLKPQGTLWVSGTYHSIYQCGHALQALGYHILNDIAWFKPNASPNLSCRYFTASHETLIWARKDKKAKHIFNYDLMKNGTWQDDFLKKPNAQMRSVWAIGTPKSIEKKFGKHPTQKPEDLLKRVVLASTNKGDLIIDPFTGSSTTGIAAYLHGRDFIGIDTDKKFLDLSIKRFEELDRNIKSKFNFQ